MLAMEFGQVFLACSFVEVGEGEMRRLVAGIESQSGLEPLNRQFGTTASHEKHPHLIMQAGVEWVFRQSPASELAELFVAFLYLLGALQLCLGFLSLALLLKRLE